MVDYRLLHPAKTRLTEGVVLGKYKYTETEQKKLLDSIVILVDTREKVNDHITDYFDKFSIPYKRKSLKFGDYSFYVPKNEDLSIFRDTYFNDEIFIERKANLEELSTNFSSKRADFEEEFAMAKAKKKYLLIENANYEDIVNGNYDTQYNKKSYLGSLHSFNHKFNIEIVFMKERSYSPIFIYGTMQYFLRDIIK